MSIIDKTIEVVGLHPNDLDVVKVLDKVWIDYGEIRIVED
jgi:hypothetical protein